MNGYQKYKEKSISSMSSLELLLLLYDEAVKRLTKAGYALEDEDYGMFEDSLTRASKIVRYLIDILDMNQPISINLRQIYNYLIYDISRVKAGRQRNKDEIVRISKILTELRDAFEEAGSKTGDMQQHMAESRGVLG